MERIYESPDLLADAIRRSRDLTGWSQQQLADELGASIGSVKRMEAGDLGALGRNPKARRATAIQVAEITGAPRELFGLPGDPEQDRVMEQRVAVLEMQMRNVLRVLESTETPEVEDLKEAGDAVARQYDSTRSASEGQDPGAANG